MAVLCAAFIVAALSLGKSANLVAALYMLTPAVAAALVRTFVDEAGFDDAALRPGPWRPYGWVFVAALGLVVFQYAVFLGVGAVSLDLSGQGFLEQIERAMPGGSKTLLAELPPGMTVPRMLVLYTLGGLTVFNLPGIVLGFGEEFGWRGYLFPRLYARSRRLAFVGGGLIWFVWHWPLALLAPASSMGPLARSLDFAALAIGALASFALFAWIFVRCGSVWAPALFHAVLNNGSRALSYWVHVENQLRADVALSVVMVLTVLLLWRAGQFEAFARWRT